jgi:hypothetical protein
MHLGGVVQTRFGAIEFHIEPEVLLSATYTPVIAEFVTVETAYRQGERAEQPEDKAISEYPTLQPHNLMQ